MKRPAPLFVLLACSATAAQYVRTPATRITSSVPQFTEPAIVASPLNSNDVLVGFNTGDNLRIAVSLDGGLTFTAPGVVPPPAGCDNTLSVDPMVAASFLTGDLYVGAFTLGHSSVVGRKPLGSSSTNLAAAQVTLCNVPSLDKNLMAIGPWPSGGQHTIPEVMYVVYKTPTLYFARSLDIGPVGTAWDQVPQEILVNSSPRNGSGPFPVVLRSGPSAGRVVVSYTDPQALGPVNVLHSDTAGNGDWFDAGQISHYDVGDILPVATIINSNTRVSPIPGGVRVVNFPSVSADPQNNDLVYVAQLGTTLGDIGNLDIFLSRSSDSGSTFSTGNTHRVLDEQLRPANSGEGVSDEFMVSMAVDGRSGINLLFCRTADPDDTDHTRVTVRYAHWNNWASLAAGDRAFTQDLSLPFLPLPGSADHDYQWITAVGECTLYAAWASPQADLVFWDRWDIYVNQITVTCITLSDITADGAVNLDDATAFNAAYASGAPAADVNHDESVNLQDVMLFSEDYAAHQQP